MSKSISCADTARLIRQSLKEAFPGVKFTVRSSTYSGGASIRVGWTDGPNVAQVEAVSKTFSGGYFDGMQDLKGATYALMDGEVVRFGADFVFSERAHSPALVAKACASVARTYGLPQAPSAEDFLQGRLHGVRLTDGWGYDVAQLVHQNLAKRSDRLAVAKSKTAGRVIYLGNDGHSDKGALQVEVAA